MPNVFWWNGHRFYFFSNERDEPPHVHVDKGGANTKIWLEDCTVALNRGFKSSEIKLITDKVDEQRLVILEKWHDHFGG
ncbi:MAG TPA: DUF4160 domain-containing protein [Caulobacteraceae bacterium]|nr:DUF4160 domain-containing protein [Caulobacteraceae bacterium]